MKNWSSKKFFFQKVFVLSLAWFLIGPTGSSFAKKTTQEFLDEAKRELSYWNVDRVEAISKALTKKVPKEEVLFYLQGTISFYRGKYEEAQKYYAKIKDISLYESPPDGFSFITQNILNENIPFKEKAQNKLIVRYHDNVDQVMIDFLLEGMEKVREEIGKDLQFFPKEAIVMEIYPSAKAFIAASPLSSSEVKTSGTVALCKYGRILLTTPRSLLRGYPWMDTLSHEYVHYALTRRWGHTLPVWLHEGIAKNLEIRWRRKDRGYLSLAMKSQLAEALETDRFVTFEQMHPSFAKLPSSEVAQLAYAQVASLVNYLVEKRGGWKRLLSVLDHMEKGYSYELAFAEIYDQSLEEILEDWKAWLKKKDYKKVKGLDPLALQVVDTPEEIQSSPRKEERGREFKKVSGEQKTDRMELSQIASPNAREHLHLGDLLRYRGRTQAARVEYERALEKTEGVSPIISTKLARVYLLLQDDEKAQKILEEILRYYPQEGLAQQLLGEVYFSKKEFQKAVSYFEGALFINPFNPELHAHLVKAYKKLGQSEKRIRSEKALDWLTADF